MGSIFERKSVKRKISVMIALVMVTSFMLAAVSASGGNYSRMETVLGKNPKDLIADQDFRFETPISDSYLCSDKDWDYCYTKDGNTVKFNIKKDTAGNQYLEWSSNTPLTMVVVKGGPAANVYYYDEGAYGDSYLYAPVNPSGKPADISWFGFNFGEIPPLELGGLIVEKEIWDENGEEITDFDASIFTVRVTNEDGEEVATLSLDNATLDQLTPGLYTIEEINLPEGYSLVKYVEGVREITEGPITVNVTANTTVTVVVVNQEDPTTPQTGNLIINKELLNENGEEITDFDASIFTVRVTNEDGEEVATLSLDNATLDQLTPGLYTIEEINLPEGYSLVKYVEGVREITEGPITVNVTANTTVTVVVVNQEEGEFEVPPEGPQTDPEDEEELIVPGESPGTEPLPKTGNGAALITLLGLALAGTGIVIKKRW